MKLLFPERFLKWFPPTGVIAPGRQAGFTLLEGVVVMAIIVVVLTIATPSISRYMEIRSTGNTADELQFQLQRAKMTAIKEHGDVFLIAYRDINQYCIDRTINMAAPGPGAECFDLGSYSDQVVLVNEGGGNNTDIIGFTPTGIARQNGVLRLTNKENDLTFNITVTGAGGISKRRAH